MGQKQDILKQAAPMSPPRKAAVIKARRVENDRTVNGSWVLEKLGLESQKREQGLLGLEREPGKIMKSGRVYWIVEVL